MSPGSAPRLDFQTQAAWCAAELPARASPFPMSGNAHPCPFPRSQFSMVRPACPLWQNAN